MKLLKTSEEIGKAISRCIKEYSNISFAVAWIKDNKIYQKLLKNKDKIQFSTVGIDFAGTDVNVLKDFQNSNKVKIYKGEYTFHPKIYVFYENKKDYTVIIGSANLTNGGMLQNDECAILFTVDDKGIFLKDILIQLKIYFNNAIIITEGIINEYSKAYKDIKKNNEIIQKRLESTKQEINEAIYINLKWDEVSNNIRSSTYLNIRIEVLDEIQDIFRNLEKNNKSLFYLMKNDEENFKKVIGRLGDYRAFGGLFTYDMKRPDDKILSKYLSKIKLGPINQADIFNQVKEYLQVMNEKNVNIGIATRLLAVKRPDLFLCVNDGNQNSIKELFGFKISGNNNEKKIENYIKLLKIIYNSDYFNHKLTQNEKQDKALVTISKYRVALLDSLLRKENNNI